MLRIVANDVILRHDSLWPRGLNELLFVRTPLEVAELRRSCLRHRWPPSGDEVENQLDLPLVRRRLGSQPAMAVAVGNGTTSGKEAEGIHGGKDLLLTSFYVWRSGNRDGSRNLRKGGASLPFPSSPLFLSLSALFPFPLPLEVRHLKPARRSGERCELPHLGENDFGAL